MKNYTLALLLLASTSISYAKEKKVQHDAHEHGVAEMNIVWEKDELNIELLSPAFNITGFEHQPSNHEQEEVVEKIEKELNSPNELFAFKGVSCKAEHVKVESPFEDHDGHKDHDKHERKNKHEEHEHAKHDDHDDHKEHKSDEKHADHDDHKEHASKDKHDDHDDHKDHDSHDKHAEHDEHKDHDEHDHEKENSTHSEYSISYEFKCEGTSSELTIETAELFKHLPQMEKIKVQWLSATSQSSSLLTKESNSLTLK